MEYNIVTLSVSPNEGYWRSAEVEIHSTDGLLSVVYTIEQNGDMGVDIDPEAVPDDEIWYTTNDGKPIDLNNAQIDWGYPETDYGVNVISNTYSKVKVL